VTSRHFIVDQPLISHSFQVVVFLYLVLKFNSEASHTHRPPTHYSLVQTIPRVKLKHPYISLVLGSLSIILLLTRNLMHFDPIQSEPFSTIVALHFFLRATCRGTFVKFSSLYLPETLNFLILWPSLD
jgi:hypothetical protein